MVAAHSLTFNPAKYGDGMIQGNPPLIAVYSTGIHTATCISYFPFPEDRFKDDDAPLEERLAMLGRDAAGAVGSSRLLWDVMGEIATNVGEEITDNAEHVGTAGKR